MGTRSTIEWTEATWNPITGCTKISPGCRNCYAERMSHRLQAMGQKNYVNAFELTLHPQMLTIPEKWKTPQVIFVNSMSDLFHQEVPLAYIEQVFEVMNRVDHHVYQVLTKRSDRLAEVSPKLDWAAHIWMGVSVESKDYMFRIDDLRNTGAHIKFLSLEPLISALPNLELTGIDWVIVGGESGPGSRPMEEDWVIDIRDQCANADVPFFFKQWGGPNKKRSGRVLQDRTWDAMPSVHATA